MKTLRTASVVALVSAASLVDSVAYAEEGPPTTYSDVATSGTAEFAAGVAIGADSQPVVVDTVCSAFGTSGCQARGQVRQRYGAPIWTYVDVDGGPLTSSKAAESLLAPTAIRSSPLPSAMKNGHELRHRRRGTRWHDRREDLAADISLGDVQLRQGRLDRRRWPCRRRQRHHRRRKNGNCLGKVIKLQRRDWSDHLERKPRDELRDALRCLSRHRCNQSPTT